MQTGAFARWAGGFALGLAVAVASSALADGPPTPTPTTTPGYTGCVQLRPPPLSIDMTLGIKPMDKIEELAETKAFPVPSGWDVVGSIGNEVLLCR